MNYTIVITEEQRQLMVDALAKFSEYTLGQTTAARESAKKLEPMFSKALKHGTNDLTK